MPRKTQKGGLTQTYAETQLWRATTQDKKKYWADIVKKEREQKGGSFKGKAKKIAIGTASMAAIALPIIAQVLANKSKVDRMFASDPFPRSRGGKLKKRY